MQAFADLLCRTVDATTRTQVKLDALIAYFREEAPPGDAAWAVYILAGRRMKRLNWSAQNAATGWLKRPGAGWLVEETYQHAVDLAETISLLMGRRWRAKGGRRALCLAGLRTRFSGLRSWRGDSSRCMCRPLAQPARALPASLPQIALTG